MNGPPPGGRGAGGVAGVAPAEGAPPPLNPGINGRGAPPAVEGPPGAAASPWACGAEGVLPLKPGGKPSRGGVGGASERVWPGNVCAGGDATRPGWNGGGGVNGAFCAAFGRPAASDSGAPGFVSRAGMLSRFPSSANPTALPPPALIPVQPCPEAQTRSSAFFPLSGNTATPALAVGVGKLREIWALRTA